MASERVATSPAFPAQVSTVAMSAGGKRTNTAGLLPVAGRLRFLGAPPDAREASGFASFLNNFTIPVGPAGRIAPESPAGML